MNLRATLEMSARAYEKRAESNPKGTIEVFGERVSYSLAAAELRKVVAWVYSELDTGDVQQVIRCKNCANYRKYRSRKNPRAPGRWLCKLDKVEREPEFFCAAGQERGD